MTQNAESTFFMRYLPFAYERKSELPKRLVYFIQSLQIPKDNALSQ